MGKKNRIHNIGFISTRIAGTDGVSFEIRKWAEVLERNGYTCFFFGGEIDRPPEKSRLCAEAHFDHPGIREITQHCFSRTTRDSSVSAMIDHYRDLLRNEIHDFIMDFGLDCIIAENSLTIPMNIPLGLAVTRIIAETGMPVIAHHHDFSWERDRFAINCAQDLLRMAFPPVFDCMKHVVINSRASVDLSLRAGVSSTVIPNVFDFASPPAEEDPEITSRIRKLVGLGQDDPFILQPTRVVPRKWIERSIDLVSRLGLKNPRLVISHSSGDEGGDYSLMLRDYAALMDVELEFIDHVVSIEEGRVREGQFDISDVYRAADLVTYPSGYEGFGNALLETFYFKKPVVVNRYPVFITDIEPRGFDVCRMDGFITKDIIKRVTSLMRDRDLRHSMTEKNYHIAGKYFSYEMLEKQLLDIVREFDNRPVNPTG